MLTRVTICGGKRLDGRPDDLLELVIEDGVVRFEITGNIARVLLAAFNSDDFEELLKILEKSSEAYEQNFIKDGKQTIADPYAALETIQKYLPDGPEKEQLVKEINSELLKKAKAEC